MDVNAILDRAEATAVQLGDEGIASEQSLNIPDLAPDYRALLGGLAVEKAGK